MFERNASFLSKPTGWTSALPSLLTLVACLAEPGSAQVVPGADFQVNTFTSSAQRFAEVAVAPDGSFVIVWQSLGSSGTDSSGYSIQARRFDASGNPLGNDFQVNSYTTGNQPAAASDFGNNIGVSVNLHGEFVVVWDSSGSDGTDSSGASIQGRRFDSSGVAIGDDFQVNTYTTFSQQHPDVAVGDGGDFFVVWDSSAGPLRGQRFDQNGLTIGVEFQVNSYVSGGPRYPQVAAMPDGGFVVAWQGYSQGSDSSNSSIQGRRFTASGSPIGDDFQVNTYTAGAQRYPNLSTGPSGEFVVVWHSDLIDVGNGDIIVQARRFGADGLPTGADFDVSTATMVELRREFYPDVAIGPNGDFVITWPDFETSGTDIGPSLQGRWFDANGLPMINNFQINTVTSGVQNHPSVVFGPGDHAIVAWESESSTGTDSDQYSIQASLLITPLVFTDGFESGDTTSWH